MATAKWPPNGPPGKEKVKLTHASGNACVSGFRTQQCVWKRMRFQTQHTLAALARVRAVAVARVVAVVVVRALCWRRYKMTGTGAN